MRSLHPIGILPHFLIFTTMIDSRKTPTITIRPIRITEERSSATFGSSRLRLVLP